MNLVLFEPSELTTALPRTDPRSRHILDVLRRVEGDTFDAGLIDGPLGKATVASISPSALTLTFAWGAPPPPLPATILLVGLPRPQTARDILRDATTLGATVIHFIATERSDPNYATSTLWTIGEWRRHCLAGAAQAFDTRIPKVTWAHTLASAIATLPASASRMALDNYEAATPLGAAVKPEHGMIMAFGPERGWGQKDRAILRANSFTLAHLGARVLRIETAMVAAIAIAHRDVPSVLHSP